MSDVRTLVADLAAGAITSEQLVTECLETIRNKNPELQAFLRVYEDESLAQARASDARRQQGALLSELDGVPVSIKDNFSFGDHVTSAGSKILEDYIAPYDATVVKKLKEAGAIVIGQTNMDEFAMGSSTENSAFQITKNPHDPARVPGGSSGGAAVSVAAGMVPVAYGSDTGGSIRQPAAFCGVVGLKPTYGAVSRYGLLAMASSLDQIGPFGQTVDDVALGYELIKGSDPLDSTSCQPEELATKEHYTIGIPKQFTAEGLDGRIREQLEQAIAQLEAAGHTVRRDIDIPLLDQSLAIYYLTVFAEVSANLARYDGIRFGLHDQDPTVARTQGFGAEVKRRIMLGTFTLSAGYADAYYKRAQAARQTLRQQLAQAFAEVDVLLGPVTPELPFQFGQKSDDPLAMYLSDIYTIFVNLAGLPGLSVPAGWIAEGDKKLPIGLQLVGKPWGEEQLFALGRQIESPQR